MKCVEKPLDIYQTVLGIKSFIIVRKKSICKICEKSFTTERNLVKHMTIHSLERPYDCNKCKKSFIYKSSLEKHGKSCNREGVTYNNKEDKKWKNKVILEKGFQYSYCICTHIKTHTGENSLDCIECGRKILQKSHLAKHIIIHEPRKLECNICGRSFSHKTYLERHMITHTGEKLYVCNKCGQSNFITMAGLTRHKYTCIGQLQ